MRKLLVVKEAEGEVARTYFPEGRFGEGRTKLESGIPEMRNYSSLPASQNVLLRRTLIVLGHEALANYHEIS